MPVVSRPQRTEAIQAKYNVTIDFPHLGLHSAAASGNLGLVKYALEHGQPINSVLDGVLPLHAACSGGNDLVVRLLIERGADVNAPRLPRRYSNDKNRDASAPIVGTSGSTPLHFACANGHTPVVLTLLMHGAHPDRPDKHGTTPEMLARENGWIACADVLQQWSHNKDKDLRERDELALSYSVDHGVGVSPERHPPVLPTIAAYARPARGSVRNGSRARDHYRLPVLASDAIGDTILRSRADSDAVEDKPARRPSLPDVFDSQQTIPLIRRSRGSVSSSRRPRSAGSDADQALPMHKVKGKISLLNIFKKNNDTAGTPESSSGYASSMSAITSTFTSPSPAAASIANDSPDRAVATSANTSQDDIGTSSRNRGRVLSEGEALANSHSPITTEIHHALSDERLRTHSTPGQVPSLLDDVRSVSSAVASTHLVKPSILLPHNRSISSGQPQTEARRSGSMGPPSVRALRFDSTTSNRSRRDEMRRQASRSPARSVRTALSVTSIRGAVVPDGTRSPLGTTMEDDTASQVDQAPEEPDAFHDEEEEHYGEPVVSQAAMSKLDTRLNALKVEEQSKSKRHSTFSPQAPLSPLPSPGIPTTGFDCPFSINNPPPEDADSPTRPNFPEAHGKENRLRGDSMSSMSTNGTSAYLTTPGLPQAQLPSPYISPSVSTPPEFPTIDSTGRSGIHRAPSSSLAYDGERPYASKTPRTALDIDIRSISSHAQAEALVQRAQQSILDMQVVETDYQTLGEGFGGGWTPLSAKLAAYGESLAIERKFKQEEEQRRSPSTARSTSRLVDTPPRHSDDVTIRGPSVRSLDRKFSLEERSANSHTARLSRVRRPHTSSGSFSSEISQSPRKEGSSSAHQFPASGSQVAASVILRLDAHRDDDLAASLTPPRGSHFKVEAHSTPRIRRSRTPDPESDMFGSSSPTRGVPLSRVSTAPVQDTFLSPSRALSTQERQAARATKLVKMGFSSPGSWQHTMAGSRSQLGHKHRFGGLKGFVQSLKGK